MAKVVFAFDTVSKALTAEMDGVPLENVADVMFYRDGPGRFCMGIIQRTKDESNGTVVFTQTCANDAALPGLGTSSLANDFEHAQERIPEADLERARAGISQMFLRGE